MKNKIFFLLLLVIIIPFCSSASLQSSSQNLTINKTVGQDVTIPITINNPTDKYFQNVSLEYSPYVTMTPIVNLGIGGYANTTLRFSSDEDRQISIRVKGLYQAAIGDSNTQYPIKFNRETIDNCVFSIISGESVLLNYTDTTEMKLYNIDTQAEFKTFNSPDIYLLSGLAVGDFRFEIRRLGYAIHSCKISVLPNTGLINDPNLDLILNLNIKNNYVNTAINLESVSKDNFDLKFYETFPGNHIVLKNTGNETAKNINISGEWMTFGENNFDILPGATYFVSFSVKPSITHTNQTNKTYVKNLYISGNFPQVVKNISISVQYADVNSELGDTEQGLVSFITQFCNENPNICNTEPRIIYRSINDSENYFNATLGENQLKSVFMALADFIENQEEVNNDRKEKDATMEESTKQTEDKIKSLESKISVFNSIAIFVGIILSSLIIGSILVYIAFYYKRKNKLAELLRHG